jgi:hypothetical protein
MKAEIILQNLGSYLPANTNYSGQANAFLTNGFVSGAGNVYFNAVRLGEGIVVKEDVGQGYARTFLNGLRIYSIKEKKLLADRTFHCNFYSKEGVKAEIQNMLFQLLKEAAEYSGLRFDMIQSKIAIHSMVDEMFNTDQRQMLQQQNRKLLGH